MNLPLLSFSYVHFCSLLPALGGKQLVFCWHIGQLVPHPLYSAPNFPKVIMPLATTKSTKINTRPLDREGEQGAALHRVSKGQLCTGLWKLLLPSFPRRKHCQHIYKAGCALRSMSADFSLQYPLVPFATNCVV